MEGTIRMQHCGGISSSLICILHREEIEIVYSDEWEIDTQNLGKTVYPKGSLTCKGANHYPGGLLQRRLLVFLGVVYRITWLRELSFLRMICRRLQLGRFRSFFSERRPRPWEAFERNKKSIDQLVISGSKYPSNGRATLNFGVPMAGADLCALNTVPIAEKAIKIPSNNNAMTNLPLLVLIPESCSQPLFPTFSNSLPNFWNFEYHESLLSMGKVDFEIVRPKDESDPISLNYTSGTTSGPKGVIYTHRGTYLNSLAAVLLNDMVSMSVYSWCLPMFHTNGWCLRWAVAAQGGTNVCQRNVTAKGVFDSISHHNVVFMTGGASPPPQLVVFKMEELGFIVTHGYGLTETYGPLHKRHESYRLKDIIVSGGKNINTIEVVAVLSSHPKVLEAAVVRRPDDHWGVTPCARLPHFMAPRTVVFEDLPKTSTGKVHKSLLKDKAKAMGSLSKNITISKLWRANIYTSCLLCVVLCCR
ncbi:hypothetical protein TIFTF001_004891 [Ficus carica]|uniref:AMP-dependent synthetase/ligase domain-containing protein n=1 Tax=Ficus carica TaxID=3494 RepID=A0AA87ZD72_FICCA|nr:hypothetical protein TIFTF001_004891 [Ficus carica]